MRKKGNATSEQAAFQLPCRQRQAEMSTRKLVVCSQGHKAGLSDFPGISYFSQRGLKPTSDRHSNKNPTATGVCSIYKRAIASSVRPLLLPLSLSPSPQPLTSNTSRGRRHGRRGEGGGRYVCFAWSALKQFNLSSRTRRQRHWPFLPTERADATAHQLLLDRPSIKRASR